MEDSKPKKISITSVDSHILNIPDGQGSISIGTLGMDEKLFDVLIDKSLAVNWDSFNEFYTPHGRQNEHLYPNGNWPRVFYYYGNDIGFAEWSKKREIENFFMYPDQPIILDLSYAVIGNLSITANGNSVSLKLGKTSKNLTLAGTLENFSIMSATSDLIVTFIPIVSKDRYEKPVQLPEFKSLNLITTIAIYTEPLGQAFDCESLLQFPHLESLSLSGNVANLELLKDLKVLKSLELRYIPDLTKIPSLNSWENLESIIGWNIDDVAGKRLSLELKELKKTKVLKYSSVSKLRSSIWFNLEYGIPFSAWEKKSEKIATKAYKTVLKEIMGAKKEDDVQFAIKQFIEVINALPNIETTEREDAATAVDQLLEASPVEISHKTGNAWFEKFREF